MSKMRRILEEVARGIGEGFIIAGMISLFEMFNLKFWWLIVVGAVIVGSVVERQITRRKVG